MAISNYKIAVGDYANKDVASLPNVPGESGYTPEQVKARFDSLVKNVVAPKYNNLIDALTASGGASEIGAVNEDVGGDNVQEVLDALSGWIAGHLADLGNPHAVGKTQVGLGNADNTSDADKPVSTAQAAAIAAVRAYIDTVALNAGAVSSVFGRAGDVTAQAGDYTAAQVGARPDSWMPSAADVGAVDGATGQGSAVRISNRNLLDNGDFRNPVNQRGQTSYTGNGYGIDRWRVSTNNSTAAVSVGDGCIDFTSDASGTYINFTSAVEKVQPGNYTLSFLVDDHTKAQQIYVQGGDSASVFDSNLLTLPFSVAETSAIAVGIQKKAASSTLKIYAAKLEPGSVQTLAHQENGVRVLNDPPPNYAEELAKCQRYYQLYASAAQRPTNGADCRPVMRIANPSQGTIAISGTTYYFNDANL
ncbi:hypothetical protein CE91St46_15620 [Eubacteriales bacterium]|nr:hypothetical protein CE91St46_15620 [Eubacteriales bacterium]GKH63173.1 hypothetical protein CE91St47_16420 [Eubacteriales bacterium]